MSDEALGEAGRVEHNETQVTGSSVYKSLFQQILDRHGFAYGIRQFFGCGEHLLRILPFDHDAQ